ncbi:hypothetical protein [Thiolapillus sp.]|uniref:hypothetical protein n=1 Tax=Thiolapillus sp. TaxID=2017437 RepID=UPI003AF4101D
MRYLTAAVIALMYVLIYFEAKAGTVPLDIPPVKSQPNLSLVYRNGSPGGAAGYEWRW